jgi:hypothetical protein
MKHVNDFASSVIVIIPNDDVLIVTSYSSVEFMQKLQEHYTHIDENVDAPEDINFIRHLYERIVNADTVTIKSNIEDEALPLIRIKLAMLNGTTLIQH